MDEKFNEEGVAQYLEWYDSNIYKPYGQRAMGGGSLVKYLTAEELDYLAALVPKPVPSTASFLNVFNTLLETYQPLLPQIEKERPGILVKFKKMGEDVEENQTERRKAGFPNK